jgi:DnaD/phage-associated family protein
MAELSDQTDIQQLLFIASQYVGKPLSPTEISNLLYFYDELHMSTDLIEYLVEYCVSKGSKSPHYMETVAFSWAKEGIRTVSDAKQSTNLYNRNYYKILNAFGIKGRGPGRSEIEFMDRWLNTWHFTIDIISEACSRTIAQIQQPRFEYANRILEDWHKANVHHLSDIQDLDAKHEEKKKKTAAKPKAVTDNKFNNFHQRDYDFEQLERQLLNT